MFPSLDASREEGESGRNQMQLYTYWLAVPMAFVQGYSQLLILQQTGAVGGHSASSRLERAADAGGRHFDDRRDDVPGLAGRADYREGHRQRHRR